MKSVYIESSIISYITARPSRDMVTAARQNITIEWWENYQDQLEIFVSELELEEIGCGDLIAANRRLEIVQNVPVLMINHDAIAIAQALTNEKAVPESSKEDALHIGIAASQEVDFLLTWNFKHINNANNRTKIANILTKLNYSSPIICSPEELINDR
ncbi:hypothetical protein TI03_01865 [Achromatium sp. WMS1]|nr:hypothetical protein TI03_01865 [Achromatium sp. WMS1]